MVRSQQWPASANIAQSLCKCIQMNVLPKDHQLGWLEEEGCGGEEGVSTLGYSCLGLC